MTVLTLDQFYQATYMRNVIALEWPPFARNLRLSFDGDRIVTLTLHGVHMCVYRQSLFGPVPLPIGPGCTLHLIQIHDDHRLIEQFLEKHIAFDSNIIVYDSLKHAAGTPDFKRPYYVHVVCGAGDIDVICESWNAA